MATWQLIGCAVLYTWACVDLVVAGKGWMASVMLAYGYSAFGLMMAAR